MPAAGADVYSYAPDEDDMVTDPHLDKHLRHWGINMLQVGRGGPQGSNGTRGAGPPRPARMYVCEPKGFNITPTPLLQMEKTEKTMAELQVDLNMRFEFDAITEAGSALTPLAGPGHVGLINLGNSCYMNSCLQVRASVDTWRKHLCTSRIGCCVALHAFICPST